MRHRGKSQFFRKMNEYFYSNVETSHVNEDFFTQLKAYAQEKQKMVYVINGPLTENKYKDKVYKSNAAVVVLSAHKKIGFVNFGEIQNFENFCQDVWEDLASFSMNYSYQELIGRTREWEKSIRLKVEDLSKIDNVRQWMDEDMALPADVNARRVELLISLLIGSINDVSKLSLKIPVNLIDKVKQKIQLFDGQQTRFIYQAMNGNKKRVTIQGLSGTGKTELLLHKLKDLYVQDAEAKFCFTCHNKVLVSEMRLRIPAFFDFMQARRQINPDRLMCVRSWGGFSDEKSGVYRYLCHLYKIPFCSLGEAHSFGNACDKAYAEIEKRKTDLDNGFKYAFQYMFIDESQDFTESFFKLCEAVTEKKLFIAGDIFQSIFERSNNTVAPDFMLSNCYRTDPRTLMCAHALGMGLFEETKLWWLEKNEWKQFGYNIEEKHGKFILTREPVRRFEDVEDDFECLTIRISDDFLNGVVNIIKNLKYEFENLTPDDLCLIFLDKDDYVYDMASKMQIKINNALNWKVNIAYETKKKIPNEVFVTNRNNVKGLEFPFVICLTAKIKSDVSYRNTLYTMLTRSFIRSYLIMPNKDNGFSMDMVNGCKKVMEEKKIVVDIPSAEEKETISLHVKTNCESKSLFERIRLICKDLHIESEQEETIQASLKNVKSDIEEDTLASLINNLKDNV